MGLFEMQLRVVATTGKKDAEAQVDEGEGRSSHG